MLKLVNIVKNYKIGGTDIKALNGISLEFRESEFVSILGPSGCGKTTLLNIVGGLDRYTSGDLIINGVSTKEYKDVDWDIYRNNSVGFVFQNYNLIPHQSVLSNVELAMTLAGVSRAERRKRAKDVLKKVGLGDQINKKPTQLSGGQMQRVAIARALVNNPDILMADEPTGALDSETSIQIMEILHEIAKDRLVIMVTHNGDLAEKYSTRIIKLLDGKVINDSDPYVSRVEEKKSRTKRKKISMSMLTALSLSLKNLMTKKTRTLLTAFAGSIGIIGIALILSLSSGMQGYINTLQSDTLSTYPITLESSSMDMNGMISSMMSNNTTNGGGVQHELDKVYTNSVLMDMVDTTSAQVTRNDLSEFKRYLESADGEKFYELTNSIKYSYDIDPQIFKADTSNGVLQVNPSTIYNGLNNITGEENGMSQLMGGTSGVWEEMLGNDELLKSQYDVIAGSWPSAYDEVVIVVDENNELSDIVLYSLGLLDANGLEDLMTKVMKGEEVENTSAGTSFTYDDLLSLTFKLVPNTGYYVLEYNEEQERDIWTDMRDNETYMKELLANAVDIKVVGILRPSPEATATSINASVGYTTALTDYVINAVLDSEIAKAQLADPETDVFTGIPFEMYERMEDPTMDDVYAMLGEMNMTEEEQALIEVFMEGMSEEEILAMMQEQTKGIADMKTTYESNLALLGIVDFDSPSAISLYPKDFASKNEIEGLIEEYNKAQESAGHEEYVINYSDIVGLMTSSISSIIDIISYVLIAFVAISLVVSSIMIAIITYISVLERTKEIGILRSIGAAKKDITRVFISETIIEGLVAGVLGVSITLLLNIPVNAIIKSLVGISSISVLPLYWGLGLVAISVLLTVIAGLIPSRMAAKKDPVEALRTE